MKNKIFYKIYAIIVAIVLIYSLFIIFIITPKISDYIIDLEIKQAQIQLKRVDSIIKSKELYLKSQEKDIDFEEAKKSILEELRSLIQSITIEDLGYIFLINSEAKIVLHPEITKDSNSSINNMPNIKSMFQKLELAYKKNMPYEYKWHKKEDSSNFSYEKIAWIKYNDYFDWYIVSSLYKEDLIKKSNEISFMIINISLIVLILISLLSSLFIKRLLNPILKLSEKARLVKEGRFDIRCSVDTNDELGVLSSQFNDMLDFIEDNTKNLEKKISQRTKEIEYKLYHESVTGAKNRLALLNDLKKYEFSALNLISIDDFDDINELYGYEVGDEVLIELTTRIDEFAKKEDFLFYKIGSATFAILDLQLKNFISYDLVIQKILKEFKKPVRINSLKIEIIFEITVGTAISQNNQLACANIALKNAKKRGSRFTIYNQTIDTQENIKNTTFWREKINSALKDDRVIPFFQPIFNKEGKLIKYEVLMRIKETIENEHFYISPTKFLDIAFKIKQYYSLNRIIISKAFSMLDTIKEEISINLSFSDIMNVEYMKFLKSQIELLNKEQREKIVFEILESDDITDSEVLSQFISEYRGKGIKIAIDDFGTGFSNFSYILKIKPDFIKIDGSLIKDINSDENSYEIVKSITTFSKSLGIKVIAEFVHSKEVYETLKRLDIDEFQGYYLGEPCALN
ncbi:EAL domain-containing protein [Halarcobacter ebronensis]|uniref:GGDEF domain-containing protein n=1 Tax=Halarcobacter ebronensis TaxID=1462615 RepID=A0A4Q1AQN7_9BACT|nr:EAL domain-containing protein [Halarcobacter ebronensis]QKF83275.1 Cache sensor-containing diguanylate cyclase/phosphodiesterase [Halarcobacter ebronensis]RXK05838.1 hypothetical protein CRV07_07135 [Halarcobacter ebronensis]